MSARSYLYVPGDRPEMYDKARDRGADAIVFDLEDSVASANKGRARTLVADWLGAGHFAEAEVWVRVNGSDPLLGDDLVAISAPGLTGLFVPKAEPGLLARVAETVPGLQLIALVESAGALLQAPSLAAAIGVVRLGSGEADLVASLGMDPSPDQRELTSLRVHLVVASAAAGIEPPIAPAFTNLRDEGALHESTKALMRMGFGARTAIHPSQIEVINRVFTPDSEEVERARALLSGSEEAAARGAGVHVDAEGRMVDEAVLRTARRIVALAEEHGTR